jgi:integrase/recombinase XerD
MSALRQQLIQQMQMKGHGQRTIKSNVSIIAQIASHYHTPPDQLSINQIRDYILRRITDQEENPGEGYQLINISARI